MMPDLGKYADAVLSSYAVSLLLIFFLVAVSIRRAAQVKSQLDAVENKGEKRG